MYVYMYIYIYTYMCIYIYMYIYTYTYVYLRAYIYIYLFLFIFVVCKQETWRPKAHWQKKCSNYVRLGCARQKIRTHVRQGSALATHWQKSACVLKMLATTLKTSLTHSSFGRPRRLGTSRGCIERSSRKTSFRTGQVGGLRASVPKYPSCRSSRVALSFGASIMPSTSSFETLL